MVGAMPRIDVSEATVRRLVATQFPQWADLPVTAVKPGGWDHRTFRLGEQMAVRLPSAQRYALQVGKEHQWLPTLAPWLPLPIPVSLALGVPGEGYPWSWSVRRWIPGDAAAQSPIDDPVRFAVTLAEFLIALQRVDPTGGPVAGAHSFHRGASPAVYDAETRRAIDTLGARIDTRQATKVWEAALQASPPESPVWFHGDVAAGNLLVRDGQLSAVIDFGCCGVGDPACDTAIAWTLLSGDSREAFHATLSVSAATWARGRGWALWKTLITLVEHLDTDSVKADEARRVLHEVLADPYDMLRGSVKTWGNR